MILVSASSCVQPIWRTSSLTSVELHLTSLFTEMNNVAPPKSCVNSLPVRNEFNATLFLLCLKKLSWKSFGILVASINGKNCPQPWAWHVCDFKGQRAGSWQICEHPEGRLLTNSVIPSANSLKILAVVKATWEFTIAEKSKISISFVRVDARDG